MFKKVLNLWKKLQHKHIYEFESAKLYSVTVQGATYKVTSKCNCGKIHETVEHDPYDI